MRETAIGVMVISESAMRIIAMRVIGKITPSAQNATW